MLCFALIWFPFSRKHSFTSCPSVFRQLCVLLELCGLWGVERRRGGGLWHRRRRPVPYLYPKLPQASGSHKVLAIDNVARPKAKSRDSSTPAAWRLLARPRRLTLSSPFPPWCLPSIFSIVSSTSLSLGLAGASELSAVTLASDSVSCALALGGERWDPGLGFGRGLGGEEGEKGSWRRWWWWW